VVVVRTGEGRAEVRGIVDKVSPEVDAASRMVFVEARLEKTETKARVLAGEIVRVARR
jgi:hypothetical protein